MKRYAALSFESVSRSRLQVESCKTGQRLKGHAVVFLHNTLGVLFVKEEEPLVKTTRLKHKCCKRKVLQKQDERRGETDSKRKQAEKTRKC